MAVKLRFVRVGKKNQPAFRLCAIESRNARDGAYLENIGFYDPSLADDKKKIRIDKARAEYWLSVGAQPSQTVLDFFKREKVAGLIRQKPRRKRRKKPAARATSGKPVAAGTREPGAAAGAASTRSGKKPKPPKKPKAPRVAEGPKA
jgi:small subunit ribosomal protein S16